MGAPTPASSCGESGQAPRVQCNGHHGGVGLRPQDQSDSSSNSVESVFQALSVR